MSYEIFVHGTDYYLFKWNDGNPEPVDNPADVTLKFDRLENDIYVFNDSTGSEVPFTKNLEEPYLFEINGAQFFFPSRNLNTGENYYVKQISENSEGGETIDIVTDSGGNPEYFLKYAGQQSEFFIFTDRGNNLLYFKPTSLLTTTYPNHVIFQMFVFENDAITETESHFLFLGIVNNRAPSEEVVVDNQIRFNKGDRVEANSEGKTSSSSERLWFPGVIVNVNVDDETNNVTYDVNYDDPKVLNSKDSKDNTETQIPADHIRYISEAVGEASDNTRRSEPNDYNSKVQQQSNLVKLVPSSLLPERGKPPLDQKNASLPEKHKHYLSHKTYNNIESVENFKCSICGKIGKSASWFSCNDAKCALSNNGIYRECLECYEKVSGRLDPDYPGQFPIKNLYPQNSNSSSNSNSNSNSIEPAQHDFSYKVNTVANVGWSASDLGLDTTKDTVYFIFDTAGHSKQIGCEIKKSVAGVLASHDCYVNWAQPKNVRAIFTGLTTPNICNWRHQYNHEGTKYTNFETNLSNIVQQEANPIGKILENKLDANNKSIPSAAAVISISKLDKNLTAPRIFSEANTGEYYNDKNNGNFAAYMYVKGTQPQKRFSGNPDPNDTAWPNLPSQFELPVIIMSSRVLIEDTNGGVSLVKIPIKNPKKQPAVIYPDLIIQLNNPATIDDALKLIDIKMREIAAEMKLGDVNFVPIVNLNGCNLVDNNTPMTPIYPPVYQYSREQSPYITTIARKVDLMNPSPLHNVNNQKELIKANLRSIAKGTILKNDPDIIEEIIADTFRESNLATVHKGLDENEIQLNFLDNIKKYSQDPEFKSTLGDKGNPYLTPEEIAEHFKESPSHVQDTQQINIDDKVVYIRNGKLIGTGILKWAGNIEGVGNNLAGICLDDGYKGKNNGTLKGTTYFDCPDKQGLFVHQTYLFHENDVKIPEKGGNLRKNRSKIITRRRKNEKKRFLTRKIKSNIKRKIKKQNTRKIKKQNTMKFKKDIKKKFKKQNTKKNKK